MKRVAVVGATVVLCMGLLSGCGTDYNTTEDTVFLLKNGKVVSTDVEDFDLDTYDKDEFETYVNDAVEEYNAEHGDGAVEKKKLRIEEGIAVLTLEYASVEDYVNFSGTELFTGSVAESLAAGYTFDDEFAAIDKKQVTACDSDDILAQDGLKVAVIKGCVNVNVAGKIVYASTQNTKLVDKNTLGFAAGSNLLGGESAVETEKAEDATEAVVENATEIQDSTESQEIVADGSIGDDEFDLGVEEEQDIVFDFEDELPVIEGDSTGYIYVIYK